MLRLLKGMKIAIIVILIIFISGCSYYVNNLINETSKYIKSHKDQALLEELKGTIVFESDRLEQNNTPQLYKISLKNLKIAKLSPFKIYWEKEPIAKDNLVYFLLSLTAYQKGKLSNSIEGLYSINLDGNNRKQIYGSKAISIPRMSMLAYKAFALEGWKRGQDNGGDIYIYKGQLKKIIPYSKKTDYNLEDSTPKEILVMKHYNDGLNAFYFIDKDTGKRRLMLKKDWMASYPAMSPDGKKLVFVSAMNTKADLYTINIDGTNLKRITFDQYPNYAPAWSPDGKYIVYASVRDGNNPFRNMALHVITTDGKRTVQITEWNNSTDANPTWTYSE